MFWATILVAALVHLEFSECSAFITNPASTTFYANYHEFDDDYNSPFKRETVFTYPAVIDGSYNVDVLKPPSPNTIWKNYFAPLMTDGRYIRPIKANCQTEVVYEKQILKEPKCNSAAPAAKIDWKSVPNSVIVPSQPSRPTKSALAEAMNWANYLYRNEPISLKTEEVHMDPQTVRKDPPEVVVRVNVDYKNNKKPLVVGRVKNFKNAMKEKLQDKVEPVKDVKKKVLARAHIPKCENEEEAILERVPVEPENDLYTRPERLLKKGKIQLKETRLSDHDSVVEVMVPVQKQDSSSSEEDEEEEGGDREDSDEGGEDCCEMTPAPLCEDDCGRPIIKNRFVVLHLKDGDRVIKDPLIKFLAKV